MNRRRNKKAARLILAIMLVVFIFLTGAVIVDAMPCEHQENSGCVIYNITDDASSTEAFEAAMHRNGSTIITIEKYTVTRRGKAIDIFGNIHKVSKSYQKGMILKKITVYNPESNDENDILLKVFVLSEKEE